MEARARPGTRQVRIRHVGHTCTKHRLCQLAHTKNN